MCSIFGAYGPSIDYELFNAISASAQDRGRDGGRAARAVLPGNMTAIVGQWRATPTTEAQGEGGPFDGIAHNGTIANDAELGNEPSAVDSAVLPRVLDRSSLAGFAASLGKIKGSFAIAAIGPETVFLAANYKPVHYIMRDGTIYFASMERHLAAAANYGVRPVRLPPYSVIDLRSGETLSLMRERSTKALVICSAGLDSTTVAYKLRADGYDVTLLHFTYGCRAEGQEVDRIHAIGRHMGVPVVVLPIDYSQFKGHSPLLTGAEISGGVEGAEYANEWVPARNFLMIANATAYAEANGFGTIALGNNLEESGAFPDNEEQFTTLLNDALDLAVHDGGLVRLVSPVGNLMKHEIVRLGNEVGVPFELTWSCYHDGEQHCGNCGPCYMRRTAFARNNLVDPVFK